MTPYEFAFATHEEYTEIIANGNIYHYFNDHDCYDVGYAYGEDNMHKFPVQLCYRKDRDLSIRKHAVYAPVTKKTGSSTKDTE